MNFSPKVEELSLLENFPEVSDDYYELITESVGFIFVFGFINTLYCYGIINCYKEFEFSSEIIIY